MEIEDDGLTPNLLYIENDYSGSDNLTVTFDAEVTGEELTTLDATVTAHDGNPATYYTIFCYKCGCTQGKRALASLTQCPVCSSTEIQPAYHKDKLDATTTPTVNDDETQGFCEGSLWMSPTLKRMFWCLDPTTGAAVWQESILLDTDGNFTLAGELRIKDPGSAEYGCLKRTATEFIINSHTGATGLLLQHLDVTALEIRAGQIALDRLLFPKTDNAVPFGTGSYRFSEGHFVDLIAYTIFKPPRISQSDEPTLGSGEMKIWRDPDDNKVYLVYNDPDEGQGKLEFTIPP